MLTSPRALKSSTTRTMPAPHPCRRRTRPSWRLFYGRPARATAVLVFLCAFSDVVSSRLAQASPCGDAGTGWCRARRISGDIEGGELGFRFGEPLDVDGDRIADIAAGARFKVQKKIHRNGIAMVWSGKTGALIRSWDGPFDDGEFGHWVLPIADISGDALADLVIAAPNAKVGAAAGVIIARSPKTGKEIWRSAADRDENRGWDLALAGDHNGDGRTDIFAGAPSARGGRVYLLSGKDGTVLHTFEPKKQDESFGSSVAALGDLDGDGRGDLAVGAFREKGTSGAQIGGAYVYSTATGTELYHWTGSSNLSGFGELLASLGDINGDGRDEIVVAAPRTHDRDRLTPGEVFVYSGVDGKRFQSWKGKQNGELYGRMVMSAGDLDGDGIADIAISSPAHQRNFVNAVGRIEFRSGRNGSLLHEMFGEVGDSWFGWHIRRAPDPDGLGRPALLIGSHRHPLEGKAGVGVLDLYVLRSEKVGKK